MLLGKYREAQFDSFEPKKQQQILSKLVCPVLTSRFALSQWDRVVMQQQYSPFNGSVQVLLFPGLVQIALRLQQP